MNNDFKNGLIVATVAVVAYLIYKKAYIDKKNIEPKIEQPIEPDLPLEKVVINMPAPLSL